ncbi:hypothetical protein WDU94_004781 [Cyamophila willieti]
MKRAKATPGASNSKKKSAIDAHVGDNSTPEPPKRSTRRSNIVPEASSTLEPKTSTRRSNIDPDALSSDVTEPKKKSTSRKSNSIPDVTSSIDEVSGPKITTRKSTTADDSSIAEVPYPKKAGRKSNIALDDTSSIPKVPETKRSNITPVVSSTPEVSELKRSIRKSNITPFEISTPVAKKKIIRKSTVGRKSEDEIESRKFDDTNNSFSNSGTSTSTTVSKKGTPRRSNAKKDVQITSESKTSKKVKETTPKEIMVDGGDEQSSDKPHSATAKSRKSRVSDIEKDTEPINQRETSTVEEDKMDVDNNEIEKLDGAIATNIDETSDAVIKNQQVSETITNSAQTSKPKRGRRTKREVIVDDNDSYEIESDDGSNNSSDIGGNSKNRQFQKRKCTKTSRRIASDSEAELEKIHEGTEQNEVPIVERSVSERPKRQSRTRVQLQVESDDSNTEDDFEEITTKKTPVQTKGRRGRPGRPPKKKVSDDVDFENAGDNLEKNSPKKTPVPTKKGPGRPPKNVMPDEVEKEESMDEDDDDDNQELVTCQICSKEMKANVFERKHKKVHHGICWTQNDTPIDYFNPQLVLEILGLKRKQLIMATGRKHQLAILFPCFFCSEVKRSELGYYSHLLVCNRSEEDVEKANINCDRCEKTIFLPHYHAHQRTHWQEKEVERAINEKQAVAESPDTSNSDGKRFAARKAVSKILNYSQDFIDEDGDGKTRKRKKEDDEFEMDDNEESDEYEEEGEDEALLDKEFEADEEEGLYEEMLNDNNSDKDLNDEDGNGDLFIPGAGGRKPLNQTYSGMRDLKSRHNMRESSFSLKPLYSDFKVPLFEFLSQDSAEKYLPHTKVSMLLTSPQRESYQMDLFSTDVKEKKCILFCGGPVWAMAWAPQPFSQTKSDEYLALAAQPDMNQSHEKNISQSYKSLIQVWKFTQMSCLNPIDELQDPRLIFGIAHEEGAVWDLKWCPSGGYIENERLGLLAVACSSGRVLVYAVPWLGSMNCSGRGGVVLLEPVLTLQLDETNSTPCYHIAWKSNSPHELIYAGYGDGYVSVFNIQSHMSPMLQLKHKVILPINMFQAHQTEILTLSLTSCKNTFLLLTCGNDRLIKVWDLTDSSCPIQVTGNILQKKSMSGGFVPYLPLYATGSDYTHFNNDAGIGFFPVRDFCPFREGMNRFMNQTAAHFTMSFSEYTCSLVTGNEDGKAYLLSFGMGLFSRMNKETPVNVLHSKLIDLSSSGSCDNTSDTTNEKLKSTTYEHACQKYKIDFFSIQQQKEKIFNEEIDILSVISSCWNNNANNFQYLALGQRCGFVHIKKNQFHSKVQLDRFFSYLDELNSSTK